MKLETTWYECSPYIYMVGGLVCLLKANSGISFMSGLLLIAAAGTIMRLRWYYRKVHHQTTSTPGRRSSHGQVGHISARSIQRH